jgi:hypothetical protein
MRIFIQGNNASPDRLVREALYLPFKAGIYSAEGRSTLSDPAAISIDAAHAPKAVATLRKAGMRASPTRT